MSEDTDPVVGHKTYRDENGTRHEPLRQSEAEALMASIDAAKQRRAELMPTEQDAARMMWEAYHRLEELGWRNATYCPRDGRTLLFIEAGSSGIHEGHCDDADRAHRRPTVWLHDAGDLWPSQPVLYREPPNDIWTFQSSVSGLCHRMPPAAHFEDGHFWPITGRSDWCGEFKSTFAATVEAMQQPNVFYPDPASSGANDVPPDHPKP